MNRYMKVMLAGLLILAMVSAFLPSSYVSAGGLVENQSFEQGEGEVPYEWNLTGNAMRIDTGPIYAGNWSAQITGDNDTLTQWLEIAEWIGNLTMGMNFDVWGWMYVSGNVTGTIAFDFWECEGNEMVQLSPTTMLTANDTNGAYVQRTGTIKAPPCTTHVRIHLMGTGWDGGDGGEEVRFDEIGFWLPAWWGFCFIATAAYGTETASQLDILRDFRDQILLKNVLGSRFVKAYYTLSPPVANFIAKNDFLRAVVREALIDPLVNLLQWSQDLWRISHRPES